MFLYTCLAKGVNCSFLLRGSIATLTGARLGCNFNNTLFSTLFDDVVIVSSVYASTKNAMTDRSTPAEGSIT